MGIECGAEIESYLNSDIWLHGWTYLLTLKRVPFIIMGVERFRGDRELASLKCMRTEMYISSIWVVEYLIYQRSKVEFFMHMILCSFASCLCLAFKKCVYGNPLSPCRQQTLKPLGYQAAKKTQQHHSKKILLANRRFFERQTRASQPFASLLFDQ